MNYVLENITNSPDLWFNKDPVRPELSVEFRTSKSREVYGLRNSDGAFISFMCVAYVTNVPTTTEELDLFSSPVGRIAIPYTVWRYEKGGGREIISKFLKLMLLSNRVNRVVTLSPVTNVARKFHIRNKAFELSLNKESVNFEYPMV
jgi:hypothetical protein